MNEKTNNINAYFLLITEIGKENETIKRIKKISNVKEVYRLTDYYDFLLHIETPNMHYLNEKNYEIKKMVDVRVILPLIVVKDKNNKPIGFKKDSTGKIVYENIK
ncbi:MAG: Lrp/AsnC family transcriptional regulator [Candidatus Aenigmatarchaeota archaeon]